MKRLALGAMSVLLVSGVAISAAPDAGDSLLEYSDYRDSEGEARLFWQYQFGHTDSEVNGLRYGLRYDHSQAFRWNRWQAPMLELVHDLNDPVAPFEFNVSGLNMLDKDYRLNADGEGINWLTWGTVGLLAGATWYAIDNEDDGDDRPTLPTNDAGGDGGDDGGDTLLGDTLGGDTLLGDTLLATSVPGSHDAGGYGYVPSLTLPPHEIEKLKAQN